MKQAVREQDKEIRAEMQRSLQHPTPDEMAETLAAAVELDSLFTPSEPNSPKPSAKTASIE